MTLQCAGNRLNEVAYVMPEGPAKDRWTGIQGGHGAISNAWWDGVLVSSLLKEALGSHGLPPDDDASDLHVELVGADGYACSMPYSYVADERNEVMVAWSMNGGAVPPDHGRPLRLLVPGAVGARSVKWIDSISVTDKPSSAPWQQHYYREQGSPITEWPVQSIITHVKGLPVVRNAVDSSAKAGDVALVPSAAVVAEVSECILHPNCYVLTFFNISS